MPKKKKGRKWTFQSTLDNKQYSCPLFLKSIIGLKTFMELFKINIKRVDIQNGSYKMNLDVLVPRPKRRSVARNRNPNGFSAECF